MKLVRPLVVVYGFIIKSIIINTAAKAFVERFRSTILPRVVALYQPEAVGGGEGGSSACCIRSRISVNCL